MTPIDPYAKAGDQRWRDKVTDMRQWYSFGASERYRATGESHEYYSDSSGKSGGQKEKLAYTILASAISYQYNISWEGSPRTFRLVVIDEAFGRGSKESTRYGLELFGKMNLQLLIVTPGEKIGTARAAPHRTLRAARSLRGKRHRRNLENPEPDHSGVP